MNARRLLVCLMMFALSAALVAQDTDSLDVSIVIDASGSMSDGLMNSAVNASAQFVQLLETGDELAISAYSIHARTYYQMNLITSNAQISSAVAAMNSIQTGEYTSIGAGMVRGLLEMNDIVSVNPTVGMILLSDGLENYRPMVQQVIGSVPAIVQIHTIGYGGDCDEGLMQAIANATGATYHFANQGNVNTIVQDIWNELICGEEPTRFMGVASAGRTGSTMVPVTVHPGAREIVFSLVWNNPESDFKMYLVSPSGRVIESGFLSLDSIEHMHYATQTFFRFNAPEAGEWSVVIEPSTSVDENYLLTVSEQSPLTFNYEFDRPNYRVGDFVGIDFDLRYQGQPLFAEQITAIVERADGSTFEIPYTPSEFSDAQNTHRLGFVADAEGSYTVRLHAAGATEDGAYSRHRGKSVYVGPSPQFDAAVPGFLSLEASNYPNPFNPMTTIRFSIPEQADVQLDIYNVRGQKVRTLLSEQMEAGQHQAVWHGDDAQGAPVGSGCYLYRLRAGGQTVNGRMLLLK